MLRMSLDNVVLKVRHCPTTRIATCTWPCRTGIDLSIVVIFADSRDSMTIKSFNPCPIIPIHTVRAILVLIKAVIEHPYTPVVLIRSASSRLTS